MEVLFFSLLNKRINLECGNGRVAYFGSIVSQIIKTREMFKIKYLKAETSKHSTVKRKKTH